MIRLILFINSLLLVHSIAIAQVDIDDARIVAKQEQNDGSYTEELGGSAPCRIFFEAQPRDASLFYTWRIYEKADPNSPFIKYTDMDFNYTFEKAGTYTVKLEVADPTSDWYVDAAPVSFEISESYLKVPNYFSPNDSPGVNDVFKVEYQSLVSFKCTIFNRWGVKLYQWNDPDQGWDGTYKGKSVKPGVYFYVIEATGSEGKRYKEMGDINILR